MISIELIAPSGSSSVGVLVVFADSGEILLGPLDVAFPPQRPDVGTIDVSLPFTPNPATHLTVAEIIPFCQPTLETLRELGRFGAIMLTPNATTDSRNASIVHLDGGALMIAGGHLDGTGCLRSTEGVFRLTDRDQRKLVGLLTPVPSGTAVTITTISDATMRPPGQAERRNIPRRLSLSSFLKPAIAISPFLLPSGAFAQAACCSSSITSSDADYSVINRNEGGTALVAHVPSDHAGVTVAGGLDLGLRTMQDLLIMGFSTDQVRSLSLYLASSSEAPVIGDAARALLREHPLELTEGEASEFNHLYYSYCALSVATIYNHTVQTFAKQDVVVFSSLPAPWQTVMADLYCADPEFPKSAAFREMVNGNWTSATKHLKDYQSSSARVRRRAFRNSLYVAEASSRPA